MFIFLLGLQDLTRGNPQEQPAKWRGAWQHVMLSTGVRVIAVETLLNLSGAGVFHHFVTVPKGGMVRYKLTTVHQYIID